MKKMKVLFSIAMSIIFGRPIIGFGVFNNEAHVGMFLQETFFTRESAERYISRLQTQWTADVAEDEREIAEWIAAGEYPAGDPKSYRMALDLSIIERQLYL